MRFAFKPLLLATMLAATGLTAVAQTSPAPAPAGASAPAHGPRGGERHFDPARMQARIDKKFADLKVKLQVTPQQEGAWNAFVAGTRPKLDQPRPKFDRAEFDKLTTPQRIDRMQEMQSRRAAEMTRRAEAVKTFYAALNPAQQKAFDVISRDFGHRHFGRHHGFGPGGRDHHDGHGFRGEGRPMGPQGPRGDGPQPR